MEAVIGATVIYSKDAMNYEKTDHIIRMTGTLPESLDASQREFVERLIACTKRVVLEEVLRGLRSEEQTVQLRAVAASVEDVLARSQGA